MASRATRYLAPIFRSSFRPSQTAFRASGRRGMATTTSPSTKSSDMPWIIGSGLIFVPTVAWILSSGKGEKHAHPTPKDSKGNTNVAEEVKESSKEHSPEPVTSEPTPEPVSEEEPAEAAPESSTSESAVSDDEGVLVTKEEVEESINKAVDADVPKEAKAAESTEARSPEPAPTPSESEPAKDNEVTLPSKEETTDSTHSPASGGTTTKKGTKSH